jgi:hypothetical protein
MRDRDMRHTPKTDGVFIFFGEKSHESNTTKDRERNGSRRESKRQIEVNTNHLWKRSLRPATNERWTQQLHHI